MLAAAILGCVALPVDDLPLSDGVISLRRGTAADAAEVTVCLQDPEIPRWTSVPRNYSQADWHAWLTLADQGVAAGTDLPLLVIAANGRVAGAIGVHDIDAARGRAEIGYWVGRAWRGKGVATRAVRLLSDWAVTRLGLQELTILVHRDNAPSRAVPERAGYADSGERLPPPADGLPGGTDAYIRYVYPPPADR
jgi:RimJ/RimL family protein N-acetyltransferase